MPFQSINLIASSIIFRISSKKQKCFITSNIFFFSFWLLPSGVAMANQLPPSNPVFCILYSNTSLLYVHFS